MCQILRDSHRVDGAQLLAQGALGEVMALPRREGVAQTVRAACRGHHLGGLKLAFACRTMIVIARGPAQVGDTMLRSKTSMLCMYTTLESAAVQGSVTLPVSP